MDNVRESAEFTAKDGLHMARLERIRTKLQKKFTAIWRQLLLSHLRKDPAEADDYTVEATFTQNQLKKEQ